MFVANNTVCMTENGIVLASTNFNKIYIMNGFVDITKNEECQPTCFVKPDLLPTITIGRDTKILTGRIESHDGLYSLKTKYRQSSDLEDGDFLYVPKLKYDIGCDFSKTTVWLYAKYIMSGYYCLEQQTNIPTIIIKPNRFSKKEASKLKRYSGVSYDIEKKIIFIQNPDLIKQFGTNKRNLNIKVYGLSDNLAAYFIHSMIIESSELKFQYKTMAYDIFSFLYAKGKSIYKISEVKINDKKVYYLNPANDNSYLLINDKLFIKVNKVLDGKNIRGIRIDGDENAIFYVSLIVLK